MLTPTRSFDDWAIEHDINTKNKSSKKFVSIHRFAYACLSITLIIFAIIPFSFNSNTPVDNPKHYSSQDVISQPISTNEFYHVNNLIFFPPENIIQFQKMTVDVFKDDTTFVFSYNVDSAIIATQDEQNAYIVDFIARVYHNYDFYGINNFDALPFTITTPDITKTNAHYTIKDDIAFISFNYQSIDYFLTVKGYENFTNINKNTITILLKELLL